MSQNKTKSIKFLLVGILLCSGSAVFADQSCKITSDEKEQFAIAHAWKKLDGNLKKTKYSAEWILYSNTKTRFGNDIERDASNPDMNCGPKLHHDMLHHPKSVGIKNGIKRYQEIFQKPYKDNPEIYFSVLNNLTCPSAQDLKIRDEYKKAQVQAINNLTYVAYNRLVMLKGEKARHTEDMALLAEIRAQINTIKPEVIRTGGDLEFLKRADAFGASLEVALKTKPGALCNIPDARPVQIVDAIYDAVKPDSLNVHTTPVK